MSWRSRATTSSSTDDGSSAVALPEVPLLAVLPGTGGLTRVTDKRKVRRDLADVFCSIEEGVKGKRARRMAPRRRDRAANASFEATGAGARRKEFAARSTRPSAKGIALTPLDARSFAETARVTYSLVEVEIDRATRLATITHPRAAKPAPADPSRRCMPQAPDFWPLRWRANSTTRSCICASTSSSSASSCSSRQGDPAQLLAHEEFLDRRIAEHWLAHEILHLLEARAEAHRSDLALAGRADRARLLLRRHARRDRLRRGPLPTWSIGELRRRQPAGRARLSLGAGNFGAYPMSNGLTRLQTRFLGEPRRGRCRRRRGSAQALDAEEAEALGLVTFALDDIDWDDEIRIFLEERASFSPDAMTGMEANLRFAGPETMETRIFGRLTAWQNWIFQRPNAVGEKGALKRYGTGVRGEFDMRPAL